MPPLGPVKRNDLVRHLKQTGFGGPFSGGKHQFMVKGNLTIRIPNSHASDIGVNLLARFPKQAQIEKKVWEKLR